ncbi:MAG: prephenate dehydratase [Bacteroidota bacterium]
MKTIKTAIQGVAGAFHDVAARKYFQDWQVDILPCDTFREAFEKVNNKEADVAVIAIENSLAGSLLPNYTLLKNSGLKIAGEIYLRIEQHLMAMPGLSLDEISEVHSHPLAIIQCEQFLEPLRKRGVKIIDAVDTALSAKRIAGEKLHGIAALASELAAEMYGLEIIARGVETNKRNFTRFLILAPEEYLVTLSEKDNPAANKASLGFTLPHQTGSLSQILSILAFYRLNLTKIQSAPIVGRDWEYYFYIDLIFDNREMFTKAIAAISPLMDQLYILGEYVSGRE